MFELASRSNENSSKIAIRKVRRCIAVGKTGVVYSLFAIPFSHEFSFTFERTDRPLIPCGSFELSKYSELKYLQFRERRSNVSSFAALRIFCPNFILPRYPFIGNNSLKSKLKVIRKGSCKAYLLVSYVGVNVPTGLRQGRPRAARPFSINGRFLSRHFATRYHE